MLNVNKKIEESKPALTEEFGLKNPMLLPKFEKVIISIGAGEETKDAKLLQNMADTVSLIAGQKAIIVKAKKSVAAFKIREGMNVGIKVTLRGKKMYNFLEKFISIASPRIKDFRGFPRSGFDGRGNYSFGLQEQLMFPEVNYDDIIKIHGMNINIVTNCGDDKLALRQLELVGFPFTKKA